VNNALFVRWQEILFPKVEFAHVGYLLANFPQPLSGSLCLLWDLFQHISILRLRCEMLLEVDSL
jgi:hypothetical protein